MFHCWIMLKIKFVASITTSTTTTTNTPTTNLHRWTIDEWDTWYPDICTCMVPFITHIIFFASWPLILISHWAPVKRWPFRKWKRSFIAEEPIFQYTQLQYPLWTANSYRGVWVLTTTISSLLSINLSIARPVHLMWGDFLRLSLLDPRGLANNTRPCGRVC